MDGKLRKSGIEIIGDVSWGTHICQFYDTKEDLMDILVPYFKEGLESNEFCVWVTLKPLDVEEAKEALKRAVPDIDVYLERGQIEIIPYTDWYVTGDVFDSDRVLNGWVEKLNQALADGYDGLRSTGDTFWSEKEDWNNFVDYEKEVDRVLGNYRIIALCTYCLDRCNAKEIVDVVVNHQFTLIKKAGKWEKVESSKRKQAEEAAIQASKNWEYTFDAVPDPIAILDNKYRVVRVNRAMAARLGVSPEECVGVICYRAIHGTDKPPSSCPHRQLLKDKLEHIKEVREDNLGGDFIVSVSPLFNSEGKITGCIHVARDINERKQAEEALKKAHESLEEKVKERTTELEEAYKSLKESEERLSEAQRIAHLGNWDWNLATNELYWSDEVYRIFGYIPQEFGVTYDAFLSYVHPEDRDYVDNAVKKALKGTPFSIDHRVILANGEECIVHEHGEVTFDEKNIPVRIKGTVQDITVSKKTEQFLANIEIARKKEIYHRIKNNLQVISSLLDLQTEKFRDKEFVENSEVMKAFRESQNRVMSIALIHEELHEGKGNDILNFSPYLERLVKNLFQTYRLENVDTRLNLDIEENIFFDMDIAIPLGIIINELVSNSFKYAFPGKDKGLIKIKLFKDEPEEYTNSIIGSGKAGSCYTKFILTVSDNGVGIPENFDSESSDSLGLQLVTILVDQLNGELEMKRNNGTEFTMRFKVTEE